jgi:hypothetical protein
MKPFSNRFYGGFPNGKAKDSMDSIPSLLSTSSSQKEILPRLPPKECPPPIELPRRSISTTTSVASFDSLSESQVPFPSLPSTGDTGNSTHSRLPFSDVAVEESTDVTVPFDIASPRVDQVLAERSPRETGSRNVRTTNRGNGMFREFALVSPPPSPTTLTDKTTTSHPPSPHPIKQIYDADASINPSLPRDCWSSYAPKDLVTHLGMSERNRQEVMWEIVASEER